MWSKLFNKKEPVARRLDHPKDLQTGDIITLKPRSILPAPLEGATLTVKKVCTYEYSDGLMTEFAIEDQEGKIFSMSYESDDDEDSLCFSRKLSHQEIASCFNEEALGELWGEDFGALSVNAPKDELGSWLADSYHQTIKEATAYFYDEDRRLQPKSEFIEDGSQELRYHECGGSPDHFSLSVEIWEDGETDIFAQVSVPLNVIEEMWPNGD